MDCTGFDVKREPYATHDDIFGGEPISVTMRVMGQRELLRHAPHLIGSVQALANDKGGSRAKIEKAREAAEKANEKPQFTDLDEAAVIYMIELADYQVAALAAVIVSIDGFEAGGALIVWDDLDRDMREQWVAWLREKQTDFWARLNATFEAGYQPTYDELGESEPQSVETPE